MSISTKVQKKLWASSGGYCCNPGCHCELLPFFENGKITNIEEMAHIIGQKEDGPRGKDELPLRERDEFENIILLCPTCHTMVDKNPDIYPKETLLQWKKNHIDSIKSLFVVPKFNTREDACQYLKPLLAENKYIFDTFGPYSQNAEENQMATELEWERLAIQKIIQKKKKIEAAISCNKGLLSDEEYQLYIQFKQHREGFEFNKLSGNVSAVVLRFPVGFEKIYQ